MLPRCAFGFATADERTRPLTLLVPHSPRQIEVHLEAESIELEFSLKKFGVFFAIAFVLLFGLFGVSQVFVVGNRSEGMTSTFPILLVASFLLGAFLMMWFDKLVQRIKGSTNGKTDE